MSRLQVSAVHALTALSSLCSFRCTSDAAISCEACPGWWPQGGPGQPAFVSPLRDLAVKDLALFCHHRGLEQVRRGCRSAGCAGFSAAAATACALLARGLMHILPVGMPSITTHTIH